MRNALLTACAYLALLALAPPAASAQKPVQPVAAPVLAPLVPMAQLQAWAVTLSGHSDTVLECDGPARFTALLAKGGVVVAKGTEVDGFVEHPIDANGVVDDTKFIDVIHLPSNLCNAMQRVRRDAASLDVAKGYESFVHETQHISLNSDDEAHVECTAFKNRWAIVGPMHLSRGNVRDLMSNMAFFHSATLPEYQTEC